MFERFIIRILTRLLPDWENAEDVRQFVLKILGYLEDLAESTTTQIDDMVVDGLKRFTADQEIWLLFYGLLIDLFNGEEEGSAGSPRVVALADEVGIDPATIILIITTVINAIRWWRKRDSEEAGSVAPE